MKSSVPLLVHSFVNLAQSLAMLKAIHATAKAVTSALDRKCRIFFVEGIIPEFQASEINSEAQRFLSGEESDAGLQDPLIHRGIRRVGYLPAMGGPLVIKPPDYGCDLWFGEMTAGCHGWDTSSQPSH